MALAALALLALASTRTAPRPDADSLVANGLPFVRTVADGKPVWLLVDTGSPESFLTPEPGRTAKVVRRTLRLPGGLARPCVFRTEGAPSFRSFESMGIPVRGVLGTDFLRHTLVKIDYRAGRCRIEDSPSDVGSSVAAWLGSLYETFPLRWTGEGATLEVKVGERRIRPIVDTGSTTAALDQLTILWGSPVAATGQSVSTWEGLGATSFSVLSSMEIAGRRVDFPVAGLRGAPIDTGIVAPRVLTRDRLLLDLRHARLYTSGAPTVADAAAGVLSVLTAVPIEASGDRLKLSRAVPIEALRGATWSRWPGSRSP